MPNFVKIQMSQGPLPLDFSPTEGTYLLREMCPSWKTVLLLLCELEPKAAKSSLRESAVGTVAPCGQVWEAPSHLSA